MPFMESASSPMGATFTRGRGREEVLGVPVQVAVLPVDGTVVSVGEVDAGDASEGEEVRQRYR